MATPATLELDDEQEQVSRAAGPCVMVLFGAADECPQAHPCAF